LQVVLIRTKPFRSKQVLEAVGLLNLSVLEPLGCLWRLKAGLVELLQGLLYLIMAELEDLWPDLFGQLRVEMVL
jgi:hypothetical protein